MRRTATDYNSIILVSEKTTHSPSRWARTKRKGPFLWVVTCSARLREESVLFEIYTGSSRCRRETCQLIAFRRQEIVRYHFHNCFRHADTSQGSRSYHTLEQYRGHEASSTSTSPRSLGQTPEFAGARPFSPPPTPPLGSLRGPWPPPLPTPLLPQPQDQREPTDTRRKRNQDFGSSEGFSSSHRLLDSDSDSFLMKPAPTRIPLEKPKHYHTRGITQSRAVSFHTRDSPL